MLHIRRPNLWAADSSDRPVVLVSPPFGPAATPSLGLSILKSLGRKADHDVRIRYATLRFARLVGPKFYETISSGHPSTTDLAGEWIFAQASCKSDDIYLQELFLTNATSRRPNQKPERKQLVPLALQLRGAKAMAGRFIDEEARAIVAERPALVGFTTVFQQTRCSLALARRIKELAPNTPVVLGGANCESVMGAELFQLFDFLDAVVAGEGEWAFLELLKLTEGLTSGLDFDHPIPTKPFPLDDIPSPDFSDYFEQLLDLRDDLDVGLLYEASRGCWWGERVHCTFCGLNGETMAFRKKSAVKVEAELRQLASQYPKLPISFTDNILSLDYFKDLLPALAANPLHSPLFCETKANLKWAQLEILRQAGVRFIQPGIESFSDATLRDMGKGVRAIQNLFLLKACRELGIKVGWNWLWGFPNEDPRELDDLASLVPSLFHLEPPAVGTSIRLDRFSPLFERAEEFGLSELDPYPAYRFVFPGVSSESLQRIAYFFQPRFDTGCEPTNYAHRLAAAITNWQHRAAEVDLVGVTGDGCTFIWDTRDNAQQLTHTLTGLKHVVMSRCHVPIAQSQLIQELNRVPGSDVANAIAELCAEGLCVRIGNSILSLVLRLEVYVPNRRKLEFLARRLKAVPKGEAPFPFAVTLRSDQVDIEGDVAGTIAELLASRE